MCFVKPSRFTRTMLNFALPKNFTSCCILSQAARFTRTMLNYAHLFIQINI